VQVISPDQPCQGFFQAFEVVQGGSRDASRREILDRVGGGDGFASGFFYGLLTGESEQEAVNLGWAHGAPAAGQMQPRPRAEQARA